MEVIHNIACLGGGGNEKRKLKNICTHDNNIIRWSGLQGVQASLCIFHSTSPVWTPELILMPSLSTHVCIASHLVSRGGVDSSVRVYS